MDGNVTEAGVVVHQPKAAQPKAKGAFANATASGSAKHKKGGGGKGGGGVVSSVHSSQRKERSNDNSVSGAKRITDVFTQQDDALAAYLETLLHPFRPNPAGAPLVTGGFSLETDKYQILMGGEAKANADGFAYVGLGADGWLESFNAEGEPVEYFAAANGATQGFPVFASDGTYTTDNMPARGTANSAPNYGTQMPLVDATWTGNNSRRRMISAALEISSDTAVNTASGKLLVFSTTQPMAAAGKGGANGANYQQMEQTNDNIVSKHFRSLAGWPAGEVVEAVVIPAQQQAFEMISMPGNGTNTVPYFFAGAIGIGMVPGQTLSWRVVLNYEAETEENNRTSSGPVVHVGAERVVNSIGLAHGLGVRGGAKISGGLGALPFLADLFQSNPAKAQMGVNLMKKRPGPGAQGGLLGNLESNEGNFFKDAVQTAGNILSASRPYVSKIPVVGSWLGKAADGIGKLFNFFKK